MLFLRTQQDRGELTNVWSKKDSLEIPAREALTVASAEGSCVLAHLSRITQPQRKTMIPAEFPGRYVTGMKRYARVWKLKPSNLNTCITIYTMKLDFQINTYNENDGRKINPDEGLQTIFPQRTDVQV